MAADSASELLPIGAIGAVNAQPNCAVWINRADIFETSAVLFASGDRLLLVSDSVRTFLIGLTRHLSSCCRRTLL